MLLQVRLSSRLENPFILRELYSDSWSIFILMVFVVTGEACGLAMGLVMLGSKSATAIEEMVGVS